MRTLTTPADVTKRPPCQRTDASRRMPRVSSDDVRKLATGGASHAGTGLSTLGRVTATDGDAPAEAAAHAARRATTALERTVRISGLRALTCDGACRRGRQAPSVLRTP